MSELTHKSEGERKEMLLSCPKASSHYGENKRQKNPKNTYTSHLGKVPPKIKREVASLTRLILQLELGVAITSQGLTNLQLHLSLSPLQVVLFQSVSKLTGTIQPSLSLRWPKDFRALYGQQVNLTTHQDCYLA